MQEITEDTIIIPANARLLSLYGSHDQNLKRIEDTLQVKIMARGNQVKILGAKENVAVSRSVLEGLSHSLQNGKQISKNDIETAIRIAQINITPESTYTDLGDDIKGIIISTNIGIIKPRSEGQQDLIQAFLKNDIIFAVGPAGTGKTYLAVAMALSYLKEKKIKRIVLARPAVEAGESLGYLPGDFKEKIDPYLKPLYDALEDMLPIELLRKYLEQGVIEIIPLAFMRGRTLNNAFVILDEAQNTTFMQMKMFLTRLGHNAKAVITGDITQIDLPEKNNSGLISSIRILSGIGGIAFVHLSKNDVVRHQLVREIIDAYDKFSDRNNNNKTTTS